MESFQTRVMRHLQLNQQQLETLQRPVSVADLTDPFHFQQMDIALQRMEKAIAEGEKIMVYGDYDCDGIMAVSILVRTFLKRGIKIGYYVPSRYIDGYGIQLERAKQLVEKGYQLVITVDNGVAQKEALTYLHQQGVDVILTDHHAFLKEVPPCTALLHPFCMKEGEPLPQCGAAVAFAVSRGLLQTIDADALIMAGVATIADMMPLKDQNRALVRFMLQALHESPMHPIHLLCDKKGLLDETDIAFQVVPKINALGRLVKDTSINKIVSFFTGEGDTKAYAAFLENINKERKQTMEAVVQSTVIPAAKEALFFVYETVEEGYIGLLASRFSAEYKKSCIVLTKASCETYKASCRFLPGCSLLEFYQQNAALFEVYGGHDAAGGFTIAKKNLGILQEKFDTFVATHPVQEEALLPIAIEASDVNAENFAFLRSLKPFGMDFKEPYFSLVFPRKEMVLFSKHLKGQINAEASFIAFSMQDRLHEGEHTLIGTWKEDTYHRNQISFFVKELL